MGISIVLQNWRWWFPRWLLRVAKGQFLRWTVKLWYGSRTAGFVQRARWCSVLANAALRAVTAEQLQSLLRSPGLSQQAPINTQWGEGRMLVWQLGWSLVCAHRRGRDKLALPSAVLPAGTAGQGMLVSAPVSLFANLMGCGFLCLSIKPGWTKLTRNF